MSAEEPELEPASPRLSAEERREVLDALLLRSAPGWVRRFAVMMTLSVVVAVMGMLQDSAAVVIGAMLIAPLVNPIMGVAASILMGWPRRVARNLGLVLVASAGSIALAWGVSTVLPATSALPDEVLARSSPDIRDLFIALAAGAAGAYATVRKEISGALPGVAVAVALVPPLTATGVLLGLGRSNLAFGAFLLYVANLVGIVVAAMVVLLAVGFLPSFRVRENQRRATALAAVTVVLLLVIGSALTTRFVLSAASASELQRTTRAVSDWLGSDRAADLGGVRVQDGVVRVEVNGPTPPPAPATLQSSLEEIFDEPPVLDVRWLRSRNGQDDDTATVQLGEVTELVEQWIDGAREDALEVVALRHEAEDLRIDLAGGSEPPPTGELADLIREEIGPSVRVAIGWTAVAPDEEADGG